MTLVDAWVEREWVDALAAYARCEGSTHEQIKREGRIDCLRELRELIGATR